MAHIVFFRGASKYDVITARVDIDARNLRARGHEVDIITDFASPELISLLRRCDLAIAYQGWGADIRVSDGRPLLHALPVNYCAVFGDHPAFHLDRLRGLTANHHLFFSSQNKIDFARDFLQAPCSVGRFPSTYDAVPNFSWADRDIDIMVAGSVKAPATILKEAGAGPQTQQLIRDGYKIWRHELGAQRDTFHAFLATVGKPLLSQPGGVQKAIQVASVFDRYCRTRYRIEMVRHLKDFPITVVGEGWRGICADIDTKFSFLGEVPYFDYLELLQRTKIALNVIPPHFDFHERIVDSAALGCAVVTHATDWMREVFAFGEEMLAMPAIDDDPAGQLAPILSNPNAYEAVAEAGVARVRADLTDATRTDIFEGLLPAALEDAANMAAQPLEARAS